MSNEHSPTDDYRRFFDETPVAFIRTSVKTGEFLMANPFAARILGFDNVEGLKKECRTVDLYGVKERQKLIRKLRRNGSVEGYEIQLNTKPHPIWVSACLHLTAGGECIEGSLTDITELVELRNRQLVALKEMGSKLDKRIATLAH